jgi:uncharacterized protein involved in exopolysaccharide biosynthesis
MITNNPEGPDFNSAGLLIFLYKWRKTILVITAIGIVSSIIFSFMIRPKFKSTVVMFPASTSSLSKSLLAENFGGKHDVMQFGEEEQAEQMLQVLNSDQIRSRICQKYNLMQHYRIDPNDKLKKTRLYEEFNDNVTFKRTEFMSVKVEVLDWDPDTAAMIANDIAALLDTVHTRMQRERAIQAFRIVEIEYFDKLAQIKAMEDSMRALNKLGIYEIESQSEMLVEQYAIATAKNDQRAVASIQEKLDVLAQYGAAYIAIRDQMELERKQLSLLRAKYKEAKTDAEQSLPYKFVVDRAYPAEKKSTPVRWLIVTVSTVSSLILAIIIVIAMENLSQIRGLSRRMKEGSRKEEKTVKAQEPVI